MEKMSFNSFQLYIILRHFINKTMIKLMNKGKKNLPIPLRMYLNKNLKNRVKNKKLFGNNLNALSAAKEAMNFKKSINYFKIITNIEH